MSFGYDPAQVDREQIDDAITLLGYGTEDAGEPAPATDATPAPATGEIPAAVRPLFEQAAKENKLVALKFTAAWCVPCQGMTKITRPSGSK